MLSVPATKPTMHSPVILTDRRRHFPLARPATPATPSKSAIREADRELQLEWLNWLNQRTGLADTPLATAAGISENTLTRFRSRGGAVMNSLTVQLLCSYSGLPGPDKFRSPDGGPAPHAGLSEESARYDPDSPSEDPMIAKLVRLALEGRPTASPWRLKTRALENSGFLLGDIVIMDTAVMPLAGDPVCAQVYDLRSGTAETVWRLYEMPYLIAASADAGLRKPLLVDNERVLVVGTITESFRSRRR